MGRLQLNPQFEEGTLNQTSNYTEEGLLSPVFDVVDYPMPGISDRLVLKCIMLNYNLIYAIILIDLKLSYTACSFFSSFLAPLLSLSILLD